MNILKFGGSSMGSTMNIKKVKAVLSGQNETYLVVVSASYGTTDQLYTLAGQAVEGGRYADTIAAIQLKHTDLIEALLTPSHRTDCLTEVQKLFDELTKVCDSTHVIRELSDKTLARILSFGERLSARIGYAYFLQEGIEITLLHSENLIRARGDYLSAVVDYVETEHLIKNTVKECNYIVSGFVASNDAGEYVLLGRGGSDFSAAIYAGVLRAGSLQLWSDVNGMLNANPNLVRQANSIDHLSYKEAFELAYFGAKVLYPPAIRPVMQRDIPVYLKNVLKPDEPGTLISSRVTKNENKIKGVSSLSDMGLLTFSGVGLAHIQGVGRRVFEALEKAKVNVIFISKNCSEQSLCLGMKGSDVRRAMTILDAEFEKEIDLQMINPMNSLEDLAIIAVVGDNMKNQVGLSGRLFGSLGENGVNIVAIAQGASERNISIVVNKHNETKAVNVIHQKFFQKVPKRVNIFITGVGNVGKAFLKILYAQSHMLLKEYNLNIKVVGIANSSKMILDVEGIDEEKAEMLLVEGKSYSDFGEYIEAIKKLNLANTVFVDNTPSETVSKSYSSFLESSISVLTCSKIAVSLAYADYASLLQLAKDKNCFFQYETSVGAALPVIKTIQDLMISGDKVHTIQAVLSGSLNFIFNHYCGKKSFAEVVRQAKEEGYTEPDPKIDLSGLDVMRKILILSREAGYQKELGDVKFTPFLPETCIKTEGIQEFFTSLEAEESHFSKLYEQASRRGNKLKIIAMLEERELSVALKEISPDSLFYNLEGKDNIIALHTSRYREPLIIRGAGAGAEVTASGVFSDLMYTINR